MIKLNKLFYFNFLFLICFDIYATENYFNLQLNYHINRMSLKDQTNQLIYFDLLNTLDNPKLQLKGFYMSDGPHGMRDGYATCFPVSKAIAASWDLELAKKVASSIASEFNATNKNQILAPSLYLENDPLNGRNAESYGEDPFLCAMMGVANVEGFQESGLIATPKAYIGELIQNTRFTDTIWMNDYTIINHYGFPFKKAIQEGGALCIMSAYPKVNGIYASHNQHLNEDILRNIFGFPFYMISDWNSVKDIKAGIIGGTDLALGSSSIKDSLFELVSSGLIEYANFHRSLSRILKTKIVAGLNREVLPTDKAKLNSTKNKQVAYEAATKSIILLKNEDHILPIDIGKANSIALIGPGADVALLDGYGSSWVTPLDAVTPKEAFYKTFGFWRVEYVKGCDINSTDTSLYMRAIETAKSNEYVVFIGGLDHTQEGEDIDRVGNSIELPDCQQNLIVRLAEANPNIIVVIESGGTVSLSKSIDKIKGLIYAFYPGQEGGKAIADIVLGLENPSGKLPTTIPMNQSQLPVRDKDLNNDYGGGYFWFDRNNLKPRFPFGFGLSYTEFQISDFKLDKDINTAGEKIKISFKVKNIGTMKGAEVVQAYFSPFQSNSKYLKGFKKIYLQPNEEVVETIEIMPQDLFIYDTLINQYKFPEGKFTILIGNSSENILYIKDITINQSSKPDLVINKVFTIPPSPKPGDTVCFGIIVANYGTKEITNSKLDIIIESSNLGSFLNDTIVSSIKPNSILFLISNYFVIPKDYDKPQIECRITIKPQKIEEVYTDNNSRNHIINVFNPQFINPLLLNIAFHKPVTASSVSDSTTLPEYAVDGLRNSRWSSEFADNQFFIIDLEKTYNIHRIEIDWEWAYAKSYSILTSIDGKKWVKIYGTEFSQGKTEEFYVYQLARFIKIECTKRGTPWGFSIDEIVVNGIPSYLSNIEFDNNYNSNIRIYPNPANSIINVEISDNLPSYNDFHYNLFDIKGTELTNFTKVYADFGTNNIVINISNLSAGKYFLKIGNEVIGFIKL